MVFFIAVYEWEGPVDCQRVPKRERALGSRVATPTQRALGVHWLTPQHLELQPP